MAPEMFQKAKQTHKVDVWSLFVTMLWTLDIRNFRKMANEFKSIADIQNAVLSAALDEQVAQIREMAIVNPEERASAAQMLVKCFDGKGLSTPRNKVPALIDRPAIVTTATTRSPTAATTKPLARKRGVQKNTDQYRVEKSRNAVPVRPQRQAHSPGTENC